MAWCWHVLDDRRVKQRAEVGRGNRRRQASPPDHRQCRWGATVTHSLATPAVADLSGFAGPAFGWARPLDAGEASLVQRSRARVQIAPRWWGTAPDRERSADRACTRTDRC